MRAAWSLAIAFGASAFAQAAERIEKKWLACERSDECASIQLGCSYWQPVNKKFAEDARSKYFVACLASLDPGAQPTSSCKNGICVNDATAR